ncbi:MAG: hypothetical protein HYS05_03320 [Acidobacteria bacterium]|nr:hypothetical protein [Acidobacteriota bacterium]
MSPEEAKGEQTTRAVDFQSTEAVKAYVAELEADNHNLREQVRSLKRIVKIVQKRAIDPRDLRREIRDLIGGGGGGGGIMPGGRLGEEVGIFS